MFRNVPPYISSTSHSPFQPVNQCKERKKREEVEHDGKKKKKIKRGFMRTLVRHASKCRHSHSGFNPLFAHAAANRHPAPTGGLPSNQLPPPHAPDPGLLPSQPRRLVFHSRPPDMALRNEATKAASQSRSRFHGAPPEVEISVTRRHVAPRRRRRFAQNFAAAEALFCGFLPGLWDGQIFACSSMQIDKIKSPKESLSAFLLRFFAE